MSPGFSWRDGVLHAENVPLPVIAEAVGTPCYVYAANAMRASYRALEAAVAGSGASIAYALKANSNLNIIRLFGAMGAGADIVSGGELARAQAAGIAAHKIVFAGVGKTRAELTQALAVGIKQFNVESEPELEALSAVATAMGKTAPVVLRVNPDVDAATHAKITTGRKENKFGIAWERVLPTFARARDLPGLDPLGVSIHIGSQLTSLDPFRAAFAKVRGLVGDLRAAGHDIRRLDLGGGLGIRYRDGDSAPDLAGYGQLVRDCAAGLDVAVELEPGRFLVGEHGLLLCRVVYVKDTGHKRFVIVDGAMNDLIRPTLYEAYHPIWPVLADAGAPSPADLVGPVCESGDYFAQDRDLPPLAAGGLLAIGAAGAYGFVMASAYNSRPPAAEVLVDDARFATIKPRLNFADLYADEDTPLWHTQPR